MAKKSYFDQPLIPVDPDNRKLLAACEPWTAENGMLVLFHGKRMFMTIKGQTIFRRTFSKEISPSWMLRRVNEFAAHVQATKLPRGPRKKTDAEVIAAPIKRIRMKSTAKKKVVKKKGKK